MPKIRRACPRCGSDDIVKDATAAWDFDAQQWTLAGIQDHETCQACGCDGNDLSCPADNDAAAGSARIDAG